MIISLFRSTEKKVVAPASEGELRAEIAERIDRIAGGVARRYTRGNIRISDGKFSTRASNRKSILDFIGTTK